MNILIIGNGFDLAHELPTRYTDFLEWCKELLHGRDLKKSNDAYKDLIQERISNLDLKQYIYNAYTTRIEKKQGKNTNSNYLVMELYNNLENNVWYEYLLKIYKEEKMRGINWIDFESEISYIIEKLDRHQQNLYTLIDLPTSFEDEKVQWFLDEFRSKFDVASLEYSEKTYKDLLDISYEDLRRFVCCMEIYFYDCVEKIDVKIRSNDILESKLDKVLSFNYTHTFKKFYSKFDNVEIHYIHGETRDSESRRKNNMVLGIDEYGNGGEEDQLTNYNIYKKFTQRIINETGFKYREWFHELKEEYQLSRKVRTLQSNPEDGISYIYVFGHSLDITDGDILGEMIQYEGVITKIFYFDKPQQAQQISNLVKMIGQKKFIEMINSVPQRIIFQQQSEMIKIN